VKLVTLRFTLPDGVVENYDDLSDKSEGITVESIAAALCRVHEPRHGYIHFTVKDATPGFWRP
jgi:hypothetical protein